MSPASKSKTKDKSSGKAIKEQQKSSSKATVPGTVGNGAPASGYNPLLGTFHTLDTVPSISSPPHGNGRFRNIDETDGQSGSSVGTGAEYDSVSNNDSCSGESEDHKDKISTSAIRQESVPGSDNDRREKIRQKNEKKHQRQREKRAQELHDKCSGYLMSRKLESLSQQLVSMGFSSERATMALILKDGRIEDSVVWLLEGGEEAAHQKNSKLDSGDKNLKIDISEELSQISELQKKYNCSKQDVERAVVACEGDLEKASENLRVQKQQEAVPIPQKIETRTVGDQAPPQFINKPPTAATPAITIQQRRDKRDFNYTKAAPPATAAETPESTNRNLQPLKKSQPKSEWPRPLQIASPAEKSWPIAGGSSSSVSYSVAQPLRSLAPPPVKVESRYAGAGSELKNLQTRTVKEPVIMMQRPQSINSKQTSPLPATNISASPPGTTTGLYQQLNSISGLDMLKSNGGIPSYSPSTRGLSPNNLSAQKYYNQNLHYQQQQLMSKPVMDSSGGDIWGNSWSTTGMGTGIHSPNSSLAAPSSLGLFSRWGTTGASGSNSHVDWSSGGSMKHCDYMNIDWTLGATSSPKSSKGWSYDQAYSRMYDSYTPGGLSKQHTAMSSVSSNGGGGASLASGFHQEGVPRTMAETHHHHQQPQQQQLSQQQQGGSTAAGSQEWTSPFAGQDLFTLPRQFVTSPSA